MAGNERFDVAVTIQTTTPEMPGFYLGRVPASEVSRVFPHFLHVITLKVTKGHD